MSSARSGVCRNTTRRRPSGRCRLRARAGRARRWRRDAAQPRERRRRPYGVVIDLIHVAEYVCKAVPVFHRHRRHRRGVRYLVRDRDGVHWCTLVLPITAVSSMRGPGSAGWRTGLGAALLRRRPKGLLPAARQELLDPSKAWWGGRRGRLADWPPYSISVSLGVVPRWYSRVVEVPVRIEVAAGFVAPGASEPPRLQPSWPPGGSRPAHG